MRRRLEPDQKAQAGGVDIEADAFPLGRLKFALYQRRRAGDRLLRPGRCADDRVQVAHTEIRRIERPTCGGRTHASRCLVCDIATLLHTSRALDPACRDVEMSLKL